LRLGGALAALAATERADVEQLVLWDPIIDGAGYVQEMLAVHRAEQDARRARGAEALAGVPGFPLTDSLRHEISAIELSRWAGAQARRIDVVLSSERADADALVRRLAMTLPAVQGAVFPSNGNWAESDAFGSALIPQSIIQGILGCVLEGGVLTT
jgi:hypothetical protein